MLCSYFALYGRTVNYKKYCEQHLLIRKIMTSLVDLRDMRISYRGSNEYFTEDMLVSKEPVGQFTSWFNEVKRCPDILEPNAMCLATADKDGVPSARFVLLKSYGPEGFEFFTNYESRKGKDLEENPQAALTFYWPNFNRQIRIEGRVIKVPDEVSNNYFNQRPLASRISASVSQQSQVVPNRDYLVKAAEEMAAKGEVTKPASWGGFLLLHERVEFWQGQTDRLHDRLVYIKDDNEWKIQRLAP